MTNEQQKEASPELGVATGSALIIGARYRDRKGFVINGGNRILDAADIRENRIRLVPERQTLPLCWESTRENFDATFELLLNTRNQPTRGAADKLNTK
jgi:hypothetical protein